MNSYKHTSIFIRIIRPFY